MSKHQAKTWRELLGDIITRQPERYLIAESIGVNPITLARWVQGQSNPRRDNLGPLLNALPNYYEQLRPLLEEDFPDYFLAPPIQPEIVPEIPSAFYAQVLNTNTTCPPLLRTSTICTLVLQQLLGQLDPRQKGLLAIIMTCIPPRSERKVQSLHTTLSRGTGKWLHQTEPITFFLGAESQAGYAVRSGHLVTIQSRKEKQRLFPAHAALQEGSSAATPLILGDLCAGCLYVSSTQEHSFTPTHLQLLQYYSELLTTAFELEHFYPFDSIELELYPPIQAQQPHLITFRQRVAQRMIRSNQEQHPLTRAQAELLVWQELEEEMSQLALSELPCSPSSLF